MANAFDQFDAPAQRAPEQTGGNPFDAFDEQPPSQQPRQLVGLSSSRLFGVGPGQDAEYLQPQSEPDDAQQYDSFTEATGKSLGNVPERLQQSFGGLVQMLGEDMDQDRERHMQLSSQRLGITPNEYKALAWAGQEGIIDPKAPIPEALESLKSRMSTDLTPEQQQVVADMGLINPKDIAESGEQMRRDAQGNMVPVNAEPGSAEYYTSTAIASMAEMAPALFASAVTRNPAVGMSIIGGQVSGESYGTARDKGLSVDESQRYAAAQAAAEAIPEYLPISRILKPDTNFFRKMFETGVAESVQEGITATLQAGIDKGTINPDMTWGEARGLIADSLIVGGIAGPGMVAMTEPVNRLMNRQSQQEPTADESQPPITQPEPEVQASLQPEAVEQHGADVTPGQTYGINPFDQFDDAPMVRPSALDAAAETGGGDGQPFSRNIPVDQPDVAAPTDQQATDDGTPLEQSGITESGTGVFRVPVDQIQVDPEQYQFRSRVNDQGVDQRLSGVNQWDDNRAGTVLLHRRNDGSLYVADGHHRVDLARRLGQGEINARVVDEADGVDVATARVEAAMNNIADGKAEPLDVAKVFRDSGTPGGEVRQAFNLPNSQVVRDGEALANLSDNVFGMVSSGQMTEKNGAAIGAAFTEAGQQEAAADAFTKVQPETEYQRQLLVNEIRAAEFAEAQGEQGGLFGDDPQEVSLMQDRLKVLDSLRQRLNSDKRLFKSLNDNADRAGEVGNQIATEANESITKQSARSLDLIGRVTTTPALNEMVNRAARRVYDGENRSQVVKDLKQELMSYEQGATAQSSERPATAPRRRADAEQRQEPGTGERVPKQDAAGADQAAQPESGQQEEVALKSEPGISEDGETVVTKDGKALANTRGLGIRFHGSSSSIDSPRDDLWSSLNIYGQGFYTTDAVDIARGYMRKGRGDDPSLYQVNSPDGINLYDLNEPMSDDVRAMVRDVLEDIYDDLELSSSPSLAEVMDEFRADSAGMMMSADEAGGYFDSIRFNLEQAGFRGYTHVGGDKTSNPEHRVNIYWSPSEDGVTLDRDSLANYEGKKASDIAPARDVAPDPTLELQTQTEEQLAEQERTRQEAEQAEARTRREEEQRANADEQVDGFTLTGSDRSADVAMAAGQDDMFVSTPASRKVEQAGTQTDTDPTDGQKEAGNYRKGKIRIQGLEIAIENPKGSARSGTDPDGNRWESTMAHHYGDIKGTKAADGDNLDVFIGPYPEIDQVFVIDQPNADGSFDEHKIMLGFANEADAREGYLANYEDGWTVGPITRMGMDEFKAWMRDGDTTRPLTESTSNQEPQPSNTAPLQESEAESEQAAQESDGPHYSRVGEQDAHYGSIQGVRANWSRAGIQHAISERNGVITVDKIIVPESIRGDGRGTEAMQLLLDYADRTDQIVALSPSTDFGGKKFRLKRFYRRLGFVDNKGANRNFAVSESMLRDPEPVDDNQQPAQDSIEARRNSYRANPDQGDLFTDMDALAQAEKTDAYDNLETRPGTTEAQRDAGRSALRDFYRQLNARLERQGRLSADGSGVSLLGAGIYRDFKAGKPVQLTGQTVRSARDLAALAQVYRDPRYETFRFILTKNGQVVSEQAITSRLPAAVNFSSADQVVSDLNDAMAATGADGYYMMHNHPSGRAAPSQADLAFTRHISRKAPGFVEHVVIDNNEYSVIDDVGRHRTIQDKSLGSTDYWGNPEAPHDILGAKITDPKHLAEIAKKVQERGRAVVIGTAAGGNVSLLTSIPRKTVRSLSRTKDPKARREAAAMIRRMRRSTGTGGYLFMVVESQAEAEAFVNVVHEGVVRDIVTADGYSVANDHFIARFTDVMDQMPKKTMRVAEDQSGYDIPTLDPDPFGAPSDTIVRRTVSKIADKFTVLKGVQEQIKKAQGQIPEQADAYMAEELFHGKVENDIRLVRERMIEPLTEAMAEYDISLKQLDEFLYALHAPERNRVIAERNPEMPDGGSGMTNAQAAEIINKAKASGKLDQYRDLARRVHRMLEMRRNILRSAGLLDEDTLGAWEASYKAYVPLKGYAADEAPDGRPRSGKGFAIAGKESQMAAGRKSKAASPVANSISDLSEAVLRHRKNEVGQTFLNLVNMYPNDSYWKVYTDENPEVERKAVRVKDPETGKMKVEVREQTIPMAMMSDRYFTTKVDGKTHYVKIEDERLMNAMRNIGPDNNNILVRSLAAVTRVMSSLNTSYNPEFVISNFSRDIQTALLNLTSEQSSEDGKARGEKIAAKTLKDVGTSIRAINASLKGKTLTGKAGQWQKYFDQFRADGAKTGWFDMKDVDGQMKDMEKLVKLAQGGTVNNLRKAFRDVTQWVEDTNGAIENGVRLSAYVNAIEAGIPRAQAASLAKNMTVNFNRRGEWGTTMNAVYMFANASVQGTNNFVRTLGRLNGHKGDRIWRRMNTAQKIAAGMAVGGFMLSLLNRLVAGEDDDEVNWWDKVPDYVKERNIVIMKSMVGGEPGEYWTIPLPYGYNIFPVLGTQLEHVAFSDQSAGESAANITLAALGSFSPIGFEESQELYGTIGKNVTPTILRPVVSLGLNENFMGGPIYNTNDRYSTPKPDSSLHFRSTPEMFKILAKEINEATGGNEQMSGAVDWSPDVMNYLVSYYGGGAYDFFTSRSPNFIAKLTTGVEMEDREIPFWRKLHGEVMHYEDQSIFYDRRDEINQLVERREAVKGAEKLAFVKEYRAKLRLKPIMDSTEKRLRRLRKHRDRIEMRGDLSMAEKDQRLQDIEARIKQEIDRFNERYNEADD